MASSTPSRLTYPIFRRPPRPRGSRIRSCPRVPAPTGHTDTVANILITGASDGLGRALARELAAAGHQLVVHGRDAERLAGIARETGAAAVRADLSSLDEVRTLAAQAADHAPGID